jgi:hypothetical protein
MWSKHKGTKTRSHLESFETLCLGGFVVKKKSIILATPLIPLISFFRLQSHS